MSQHIHHNNHWLWLVGCILLCLGALVALIILKPKLPFTIVRRAAAPQSSPTPTQENRKKVQRPVSIISSADSSEIIKQAEETLVAKNTALAEELYQEASEKNPKDPLPYVRLGDIEFSAKNYLAAGKSFELAATLKPDDVGVQIKRARAAIGQRKINEAQQILQSVKNPSQEVLLLQGAILAFQDKDDEAKKILEQSRTMGSDENFKKQAQTLLETYKLFAIAREAKRSYLQGMFAKNFNNMGLSGLAIEMSFEVLKTEHDYRDVWLILGHAFLQEKQYMDAEDALTRAVTLDAGSAEGFLFRGLAHEGLFQMNQSKLDFEAALKLGWQPKSFLQQHLAAIAFAQKDFAQALQYDEALIQNDPHLPIDQFVRAISTAIVHLQDNAKGLKLAERAVEKYPESAMAYNLLGWAYQVNGKMQEARKNLQWALQKDNKLQEAYLNLGRIEETDGNYEAALENYEVALDLSRRVGNKSIEQASKIRIEYLRQQLASGAITIQKAPQPEKNRKNSPGASQQPEPSGASLSLL